MTGRRNNARSDDCCFNTRPPPARASIHAARAVGAQLNFPVKPRPRRSARTRLHNDRIPPNSRKLAPISSNSVDSSASVTCGVYCSIAMATACSAASSRAAVRSWSRASGASINTPPRRIAGLIPAMRAPRDIVRTFSRSRTTVTLLLDQLGSKTSSGSWGRYSPIHRRMAMNKGGR